MKEALYILITFSVAILMTSYELIPDFILNNWDSKYALYLLVFFVGINIGIDTSYMSFIRRVGYKIIFVPLGIVIGSTLGGVLIAFFINIDISDSAAITSSCGYYSLSSILIGKIKGETLGLIALISNLLREIITIILAPFLSKYFGKFAIISAGGVSSSDITLMPVMKHDGKEYGIIAIFNGFVLGLLVPLFINIFLLF